MSREMPEKMMDGAAEMVTGAPGDPAQQCKTIQGSPPIGQGRTRCIATEQLSQVV